MKSLIVFAATCVFAAAAFAQDSPTRTTEQKQTTTKTEKQTTTVEHVKKDHIMFKDGKVWNVKGGKSSSAYDDVKLNDGTIVKMNGTVISKDGSQTTLAEGDMVYMDGTIDRAGKSKMTEKQEMEKTDKQIEKK